MSSCVASGIEGLDAVLGGGFLRRNCVVVSGGPGSGKTIMCTHFVYKGFMDYGEPGVYVTLTESPDEIRKNFRAFNWDLEEAERKGGLKIVDARPILLTDGGLITPNESLFKGEILPFSHIARLVLREVKDLNAKRVAIDSITVLGMQYVNRFYIRQGLLGLVQALSSEDCTSLLISERLGDLDTIPLEWAMAHGVICLNYERKGGEMARSIQILKMRGIRHGERIYSMEIGDKGIIVHPEITVSI